jgi:hypothetical protein
VPVSWVSATNKNPIYLGKTSSSCGCCLLETTKKLPAVKSLYTKTAKKHKASPVVLSALLHRSGVKET